MIAEDARVEPGAIIGDGTRVWHRAHIRTGAVIGAGCVIGGGAFIDAGVTIGDSTKIQNLAHIYAPATVGSGAFIGPGVILTNDRTPRAVNPDLTPKSTEDWDPAGVTVGEGASIGAAAVVVAGVTIGSWALVGAGAVVTRDVLAHEVVAGNPAKRIGWAGRDGHRLKSDDDGWIDASGNRYRVGAAGLTEVAE